MVNKIIPWLIGILAVLISTIVILSFRVKTLNDKVSISKSNEKALIANIQNLDSNNRELCFSIEQLNYYNDSITQKIKEVIDELKIKDRDLKQAQYLLSEATKKDTIIFRDTLFKEPTLHIDTLIGDKWYKLNVNLSYPSTIVVNPKFISEKYIIAKYKRETIDPPKKCFISRWFQKKHKIVEVEVVEKNPYIENKQSRFVEIVK